MYSRTRLNNVALIWSPNVINFIHSNRKRSYHLGETVPSSLLDFLYVLPPHFRIAWRRYDGRDLRTRKLARLPLFFAYAARCVTGLFSSGRDILFWVVRCISYIRFRDVARHKRASARSAIPVALRNETCKLSVISQRNDMQRPLAVFPRKT